MQVFVSISATKISIKMIYFDVFGHVILLRMVSVDTIKKIVLVD